MFCKICGKEFFPYPCHVYKVGSTWVCSYHCMNKGRKALDEIRQNKTKKEKPNGSTKQE